MKEEIINHNPSSEFYSDNERCHITELYNLHKDENLSIAKARVEKGVSTAFHSLKDVDEKYVILLGQGIVEVGELPPTEVLHLEMLYVSLPEQNKELQTLAIQILFFSVSAPQGLKRSYMLT